MSCVLYMLYMHVVHVMYVDVMSYMLDIMHELFMWGYLVVVIDMIEGSGV